MLLIRALLISLALVSTPAFALFTNGDFSSGTLTGWTVTTGLNPGLTLPQPFTAASININPGGTDVTTLVDDTYTDPNAPQLLFPFVAGTIYSAKVGNEVNNADINILEQSGTLTVADRDPVDGLYHIRFSYAAVLNNGGGHPPQEQPYYYVEVSDVTLGAILFSEFEFADITNPKFAYTVGSWLSTDQLDQDIIVPAASVGHTLKIRIIAAGCSQTGHGGYVYLDGFRTRAAGAPVNVPVNPAWMLLLLASGILGMAYRQKR